MSNKVEKINDPRLLDYTQRQRSGSTQVFYTGNDNRDWDRFRAEGGHKKHGLKMHDKPDTIRIKPPRKEYYAELIDGEWWWVNGCAECNGQPRKSVTYVECDKHNACVSCRCSRDSLSETPWGGIDGWICAPCARKRRERDKVNALADMPSDDDFDDWDYHNLGEIKCPYCAYEYSDSWEHANDDHEEHDCPRCDNIFTVTAIQILEYDCDRIDKS